MYRVVTEMLQSARATILVKALPQPSKTYGETVCCAGVTSEGRWLRLYPVRFRHLKEASFSRWDWVEFKYRPPKADRRRESCHVYEETIKKDGHLPDRERSTLLEPLIVGSALEAQERGQSLALIRPRNTRFTYRAKKPADIEADREAYKRAACQTSFFDEELAALDPSPFEFKFSFEDAAGRHEYRNGDWEAHAMFWRERQRTSETEALRWMDGVFNQDYPRRGMAFAIGNMFKRPKTWQLLGVLRLDEAKQATFAF
ncbi:hypothetical protein [Methylobacterium sp. Gmos1]